MKVQQLFSGQDFPDMKIPHAIKKSLYSSDQLLKQLSKEESQMLSYWNLYQESLHALAHDPLNNGNAFHDLLPRITQVIANGNLNEGYQGAFVSLEKRMTSLLEEIHFREIAAQDQGTEASRELALILAHLRLQFRNLEAQWDSLKRVPSSNLVQNFETMLELYQKIKELKQILLTEIPPEEIDEINEFIAHREELLCRLVKAVYREATMLEFYNALDAGDDDMIQDAFSRITDKPLFLMHLASVMKQKSLPTRLLSVEALSDWPGTGDQKKEAVKKALFMTSTNDPGEILKKARGLELQLEKAMGRPLHLSAPPALKGEQTNPVLRPLQDAMQTLQSALMQLEDKKVPNAFRWLLAAEELKEKGIAERPFYYLLQIHKIESPSLVTNEQDYGVKAFRGERGFSATDAERVRAVQRALVEISLDGLSEGVKADQEGIAEHFLGLLDKIQLCGADRPKEIEHVVHAIFGTVYRLHEQIRATNPSLVDPTDRQFAGDFGKKVFTTPVQGIDREIKLKAIEEVRSQLFACWIRV